MVVECEAGALKAQPYLNFNTELERSNSIGVRITIDFLKKTKNYFIDLTLSCLLNLVCLDSKKAFDAFMPNHTK